MRDLQMATNVDQLIQLIVQKDRNRINLYLCKKKIDIISCFFRHRD